MREIENTLALREMIREILKEEIKTNTISISLVRGAKSERIIRIETNEQATNKRNHKQSLDC